MDGYVPLPPLPPRISRLNELASDLWWSWNAPGREVFRDLDLPLWRFTDHNPVLLMHLVEPERLEHAAGDPEFLRLYDEAIAALDVVRAGSGTWWSRRPHDAVAPLACLAPGFSLHQALPLDGDSAAVAAGDAVKEASDLGLPFVGIGLMYPRAYLHQRVSKDGVLRDSHEHLDWSDAPIGPALTPDGSLCVFSLPLGVAGRKIDVQVWQVRAGRVTVYLIDADLPQNAPEDRAISAACALDGTGAAAAREALLAAAAPRALSVLGIHPAATMAAAALGRGIHVPTWLSADIARLVERHAGSEWRDRQDDADWWEGVERVPDEELWSARQRLRGYLVDFIRERARRRWTKEQKADGSRLVGLGTFLDPATLTIGIARRFTAGYRADVLFQDADRLAAILTAVRRPVQIVFAGRVHPGDEEGRTLVRRLFGRAVDPRFGGRIAFLDDYDLHAARLLVQGCDLWVSLPSAGGDALGPGKAAINGAPHLALAAAADKAAARAVYGALEEDLVPMFYHRDRRGVPVEWTARVREVIRQSIPRVSVRRALKGAIEHLAAGADV